MGHKASSRIQKPPFKLREELPRMTQTKEGAVIWCPFCVPSHPLTPGQPAVCGTQLKLTAVQTVIPARFARLHKLTCLKCHTSGEGEMVPYMNGYVHLTDCAPGTNLLKSQPNFNRTAAWVFHLPKGLRARVCKMIDQWPQEVREINADGTETGKIIGYFWMRGNDVTRATAKPAA